MEGAPTTDAKLQGPVVYAGRFADRVAGALPDDYPVLSEWDVLPAPLAAAMEGAAVLVVLDLFSFPFDALTGIEHDVPLIVLLPAGFDAGFLDAVFGRPVFRRLGSFDRIATPDDDAWDVLRREYGWARGQRVVLAGDDPEDAAGEINALLRSEEGAPGAGKAVHQAERRVLEPRFAEARGDRAEDVAFDVLEVGCGTGRWTASFDLTKTRYAGVDADEAALEAARYNFPEGTFGPMGPGRSIPHDAEVFDLVFSAGVMRRHPARDRGALISEMFRVARPGGRLLFLDEFVPGPDAAYPMSVTEFVGLLMEATDHRVVLEHVESLRYPGEDLTRGGVISVSRLGVPERW